MFTPWLSGERTPSTTTTIRASFVNLSLQTRREDLVRAVYEGVAFNTRWLLETVERFVGRRLDPITLIGGGPAPTCGARSTPTCWTARSSRRRTRFWPTSGGRRSSPVWRSATSRSRGSRVQSTSSPPTGRTRFPSRSTTPMYAEFVELYKQTKGIFRRLNRRARPR